MKYLLLGGNGFIGQNIVREICAGHETVVADRLFSFVSFDYDNIEFRQFDFVNDDFFPLLDGVDVVFHLISTVLPTDGTDGISDEIYENILPTIRLLDAMVARKISKIVYFSTGGIVYGQGDGLSAKETSPAQPICKYGVHKLAIEKYLHLYNVYHGLDYRVVRPSNPYSSKVRSNRLQGVIPIFIDKILRNEPISLWGDGNIKRDFIHINDMMSALEAVLDYAGPERVFNIGTGKSTSLNDVISLITDVLNSCMQAKYTPTVECLPARKCDVTENRLDVSLLEKCTGWKPAISLEEGINMCVSEILEKGEL